MSRAGAHRPAVCALGAMRLVFVQHKRQLIAPPRAGECLAPADMAYSKEAWLSFEKLVKPILAATLGSERRT
jgi:hypothetical protein